MVFWINSQLNYELLYKILSEKTDWLSNLSVFVIQIYILQNIYHTNTIENSLLQILPFYAKKLPR